MTGFNFSKIKIFITALMCHLFVMESAFAAGPNPGAGGDLPKDTPRTAPKKSPQASSKKCPYQLGQPMMDMYNRPRFCVFNVNGKTNPNGGPTVITSVGQCDATGKCEVKFKCKIGWAELAGEEGAHSAMDVVACK